MWEYVFIWCFLIVSVYWFTFLFSIKVIEVQWQIILKVKNILLNCLICILNIFAGLNSTFLFEISKLIFKFSKYKYSAVLVKENSMLLYFLIQNHLYLIEAHIFIKQGTRKYRNVGKTVFAIFLQRWYVSCMF